ncbi:hypothetical protein [Candidatus Paracaedibacter symbiosus]|uniref:hypothetical protein n=1 Tax=Candidatus Paracaedibacter symbiosus TaxID=244582 RepID=UPI0018DC5E24|nr:hypothetical protein [Candidatus Paracaedibacter symbiosus]
MYKSTRNPSYKVWVDFGAEIGEKQTSAQITQHYTLQQLVGKKVIGCLNLQILSLRMGKNFINHGL